MKKIAFFLLAAFVTLTAAAIGGGKQQYRIFNQKGIEVRDLACEKGLASIILDNYRFKNFRRNIFVEIPESGEMFKVELFSGQELLEKYGKPISPLNTNEVKAEKNPVFKLFQPQNVLKITGYRD
ncbi:MAG: hypothetical protein U0T73_10370 [Chitinophagales bacterium]